MLVVFTNEVCVKFCFKISIIHAKDYMQPQIDGIEILTQICETKKRKMQEKGISALVSVNLLEDELDD